MDSALYRWPKAAKFGRTVPKSKFYDAVAVRPAVRNKFVAEVHRITWAYKLADATIHLRGNAAVPEIQVFVVDAKDDDVGVEVLTAIDKAVLFPIIFEINRRIGERVETRMVAAYKQLSRNSWRTSAYFSTVWQDGAAPRVALPPAVDLIALYAGLLGPILPIAPRPGEALSRTHERVEGARKLEREIEGLRRRLRVEPQLNRKVELRRQLKERVEALAELTAPSAHTNEDAAWTS